MSKVDDMTTGAGTRRQVHGVLAEFSEVGPLLGAARRVRDAGFTQWDCHTPFPVHGLDGAMGVKPTKLPWIILTAGLSGTCLAFLMQWWMNAHDYAFLISGKPAWSIPANVPIAFEVTVLLSAFAAFFGCLGLNRLPELFHPLFLKPRFRKVTDDKFFIFIEKKDAKFDERKTADFLATLGADAVETVDSELRRSDYDVPKLFKGIAAVVVVLTLVPLAIAARARNTTSEKPRIHVIPDMDSQPYFKSQARSSLFSDQRAMRLPVDGTVAVGELELELDTAYSTGKQDGVWTAEFPEQVRLDSSSMERGRERFGIYCAPCHGVSGRGDGLIARRADELAEGTWVPPTSVHAEHVRAQPVGQLFGSITNGIRNMPSYAAQIPVADRWAIVAYLRALQLSQDAPVQIVPSDKLRQLE